MRILQALPALRSGGVERGTVEFAAELVKQGHDSFVLSSGGPMVADLEQRGSTHLTQPIHRKSPVSFGQIRPVRELLRSIRPDVVHVRSRMPAWIVWLAWRGLPVGERPALVSTFHGMYSVNPYSAIMSKAEHVIAVSECVRDYVLKNFPVPGDQLTVIQRGVDVDSFQSRGLDAGWLEAFQAEFPHLVGKRLVMMPGRISRWKGQRLFLEAMDILTRDRDDLHGLIVGGVEPGKDRFMNELMEARTSLGLETKVTFLGQRNDISELYRLSSLVCHMSTKPEPFGRTVTEALASGTPVAAFNRGGAAETLQACFPEGLVTPDDLPAFVRTARSLLDNPTPAIHIPQKFRLQAQTEATIAIYKSLLTKKGRNRDLF